MRTQQLPDTLARRREPPHECRGRNIFDGDSHGFEQCDLLVILPAGSNAADHFAKFGKRPLRRYYITGFLRRRLP